MSEVYTIGTLAKAGGVHVETVRYYERRKLLRQPPRPYGRIRRYTAIDLERLRFIKRSQAAGFSLAEIEALVRLQQRQSCQATRQLAADKLRSIEIRLRELSSLRGDLMAWIAQCDANVDEGCCPALTALGGDAANDET